MQQVESDMEVLARVYKCGGSTRMTFVKRDLDENDVITYDTSDVELKNADIDTILKYPGAAWLKKGQLKVHDPASFNGSKCIVPLFDIVAGSPDASPLPSPTPTPTPTEPKGTRK